jgi:hypothetical protein
MRDTVVDTQMTHTNFCRVMCGSMVFRQYASSHVHQHAVMPIMHVLQGLTTTIESSWTWLCTQVLPAVWPLCSSHLCLFWSFCAIHSPSVVLLMWHLCLGRHRLRAAGVTAALVFTNCVLPGNLFTIVCLLSWMYSIYPCTWKSLVRCRQPRSVRSRILCALLDAVQI